MSNTIALVDDDRNILTSVSMALEAEMLIKNKQYKEAANLYYKIAKKKKDEDTALRATRIAGLANDFNLMLTASDLWLKYAKDKKLVHHIFSEEGKLAMKCVCNATVTLFNELDENDDGKIDCNEIKSCCCSPSKWCKVLCSFLPKKKYKSLLSILFALKYFSICLLLNKF